MDSFGAVGDRLGQARAHRGLCLLHDGRYDRRLAVHHFKAALRLWPTEREDNELAWLLLEASRAVFYSGDGMDALGLAQRSLDIAQERGTPALLSRALGRLGTNSMLLDPHPSAALILFDRAVEVAEQARDWRALARSCLPRADMYQLSGDCTRQIAQELVIAEGTAGVHVDHILTKLGFRSRAQVAASAADHGLLESRPKD